VIATSEGDGILAQLDIAIALVVVLLGMSILVIIVVQIISAVC
jgi:hypothetical protein